ncbi:arginase family protein [Parasalinivibrio latis]|uniref:arginase family protein n=1 Tax=Parasalinivibrio latis TaxID=2952610 RepID=UPI0030E52204
MKRSFDVIGAPFNQLGFVTTNDNTVDALRRVDGNSWNALSEWMEIRNQRWGSDITDLGDVQPDDVVLNLIEAGQKEQALIEYSARLKEKVISSFENHRTPIVIGGDHVISVGTVQAALDYYQRQRGEKTAVIWIDAHADCNNSQQSNLHGKPLALLMDRYSHNGWEVEQGLELEPGDIYYLGVRDLMLNEAALIKDLGIKNYSMDIIDDRGLRNVMDELLSILESRYDRFFVSFDYDCLDGALFRSCATPNVGGFSARETLMMIGKLAAHNKFVGIDFVEYLPELDNNGVSKELMIKLIDAVWGFRM